MSSTATTRARPHLQEQVEAPSLSLASPLVTRERWAAMLGLPVGVVIAQADRGYWPQLTIGKRVFINVEAIRLQCAERAQEFAL
jgi:hypothetical protein